MRKIHSFGRVLSRTRWRQALAAASATVLAGGMLAVMVGVSSASGAIVVTGSPSSFESGDGNMALDTSGNTDWSCFVNSDNFAKNATTPAGCGKTSGGSQLTADVPNGEVEWVNGQKFDTQCPKLQTGNNPPKAEFTNVASFDEAQTSSPYDNFFYGATIRSSANGNASGDVEFNQSAGDGTTTAGCRTPGDKLLAYDFLSGGTQLSFHVLTWVASGSCFVKTDVTPCWGSNVVTPDPSQFDGESNQSPIAAVDNPISASDLATNQFSEFGANLTLVLGLTGQCKAFPQQVWESRSSGSSFTSNPQDIEIQGVNIQTCGTITVIKQTDPRGQDQAFSFTSTLPELTPDAGATKVGVACSGATTAGIDASGNFCLNDDGNTGLTLGSMAPSQNSSDNTLLRSDTPQGSYTVSEDTPPGSFSLESATCTASTGSSCNVTGGTATITLLPGGSVTLLYENQLHSGAVLITKTGKYAGCSGKSAGTAILVSGIRIGTCVGGGTGAELGGADFTVSTDAAGSDVVTGGSVTTSNTTGAACVDGLPWSTGGTSYYVTETTPPAGYSADPSNTDPLQVTVTQNAKCSDSGIASEAALATFNDLPLTDVTVNAQAETGTATISTITCDDPETSSDGPSNPAHVSITGLAPGTYHCTIVVDP